MPNYLKYQRSISDELISQKDRVRDFIGDRHWGEDGRHKEIILREVIASRLPSFASVGTGFVVGAHDEITTQIDIIVYRNDFPVLFKKNEFVIVTKEAVLGVIEVKSSIDTGILRRCLDKGTEIGRIIGNQVFNGVFAYSSDYRNNLLPQGAKEACIQYHGYVNNIVLGSDCFMKYWKAHTLSEQDRDEYRVYQIENLAFGYFISNLIEDVYIQVMDGGVPESLKRMLYPIEGTKEAYRTQRVIIERSE